jgi:hypothetical protein
MSDSTLLCILNIPRELNTISKIDEHFSKFGPVVNIEILQNEKKARVKFSSHRDAVSAMKSPEVCGVKSAIVGSIFVLFCPFFYVVCVCVFFLNFCNVLYCSSF